MTAQETVLRACQHKPFGTLNVDMGNGEKISVCCDCWNASVHARRAARKAQLSDYWQKYREEQSEAMRASGAAIGQRVEYFCRSMLGFGGITVRGTIVANRNGVAVIRLDRIVDGKKRQIEWNKGWRPIGGAS